MSPRNKRRARLLAIVAFVAVATISITWEGLRASLGDPSEHLADTWHKGHRVLDREGRVLREIPSGAGQRGRSLPLEAIGDRLILATLASEDRDFYEHSGVEPRAIVRAIGQNVRAGRIVSGASTLTQQLVKLLDAEGEPGERTLRVKVEESARAENLEAIIDKRTILEAYLNRLGYGHGLTGPEAAARGYFGVASRDLSLAQATFLAVIPRAPSYLDPYKHPDRVLKRQRLLLESLRDHGAISEADFARASSEAPTVRAIERPFFASHFVDRLIQGGALASGDATTTTLDLDLQRDVEGLVKTHLAAIRDRGATNAAVLVLDNASGEVLAYVGSADFDDEAIAGQVDVIRAKRQPGSTLKPFVYALAFARGRTASDMLADVPTSFAERDGAYSPGNFDGTFEGPISAREALAGSLNVPAIRLAAELPKGALLESLRSLGFASLDRDADHYGLSLALGSGEVEMGELAAAYMALARGGEPIAMRMTQSKSPQNQGDRARVMQPGVAAMVTDVLSDPLARVRGLHGRGPFDIGFPVALKTGTSSGYRDTWTVGFTHERTIAVWIGNASGAPTDELTGASGAGPLFSDAMRRAMADVSARAPLFDDALLDAAEVCPLSGKLATDACSEHVTRRFIHGHGPTESCDVHVHAARVASGVYRCDPEGVTSIAVLPEAYDAWLSTFPKGATNRDPFGVPWLSRRDVSGCGDLAKAPPEVRIERPAAGSVYLASRGDAEAQAIEVRASITGDTGGVRVAMLDVLVDGEVAARVGPPFRADVPLTRGDHELRVRPSDPTLAVAGDAVRFSVR